MLSEHRIFASPAYGPPSRVAAHGSGSSTRGPVAPGLGAPRPPQHQPRALAGSRVAGLRAEIDQIERQSLEACPDDRIIRFGDREIDSALPWGGLPRGVLHEVVAGDYGAGVGFVAALLGRLAAAADNRDKQILWCLPPAGLYETGNFYAPGLAAFGIDPAQVLAVRGRRDADIQWTMEEGLRCQALMAVVGEVRGLDLTASRRLQLAARRSGVTAFFLMQGSERAKSQREPSAAVTRWRVTSVAADMPQPGSLHDPAWELELIRCRAGLPRQWRVGLDTNNTKDHAGKGVPDVPGGFRVAAALRDRPFTTDRGTPNPTQNEPGFAVSA